MKKLMLVLVVLFFGFPAFAQNTANLLNNYMNVKNALVNGDSKAASEATASLYESIKKEDGFNQKQELLQAAEKLNKAGNIEKQRAELNNVSVILWKLVENDKKLDQTVYYQYCPMKKTYWLSKDKEIKNPYYGSSMLTCGKVTSTKQ
ncbi:MULTISPECIES: DUF3347 domain-containing protein [Flavobacterium]|jgi:hypothetical protein|uniref:DUF3347 domain-containing protein n=1 Tax=Flavobacterium TaxID=237 RepID=UPI0009686330|nr:MULTISPECIES: DUF3347 domain-containing protein [Flavobacterium]OJX54297.1 MAG: hypothetical protein BGO88_11645 [Flavobacterium sp. 38-13]THD33946.1 MAG: DUF3347 domain-containing protein [Flavobacterium johnsoniae]